MATLSEGEARPEPHSSVCVLHVKVTCTAGAPKAVTLCHVIWSYLLAKRSGCVLCGDAALGDRQVRSVATEGPLLARVQSDAVVGPLEFHRYWRRDHFLAKGPILTQVPSCTRRKVVRGPIPDNWRICVVTIPMAPVALKSQRANGEYVATAHRDGNRLIGSQARREIQHAPIKSISALAHTCTLDVD